MKLLRCQEDLAEAVASLVRMDSRLMPVFARTGMPQLRRRDPGFAGLALIVVGQQLSVASAAAVWGRVAGALDPVKPQAVLQKADADLGRLGLSGAKIRTLKAIAGEIIHGRLDLEGLATIEPHAAHAILTSLPGIGPWSADIYLLFCLGHADAWPAGDLAVQEGVRAGLGLAERPGVKEMAALAEPWRPFRGAAAHLWWDYYRANRNREGSLPPAASPHSEKS